MNIIGNPTPSAGVPPAEQLNQGNNNKGGLVADPLDSAVGEPLAWDEGGGTEDGTGPDQDLRAAAQSKQDDLALLLDFNHIPFKEELQEKKSC